MLMDILIVYNPAVEHCSIRNPGRAGINLTYGGAQKYGCV